MKKLNVCPGSKSQFIKYAVDRESASGMFWFLSYLFFLAVKKTKYLEHFSITVIFCLLEGKD